MVLKYFKMAMWICTAPLLMITALTWLFVVGSLAALLVCIVLAAIALLLLMVVAYGFVGFLLACILGVAIYQVGMFVGFLVFTGLTPLFERYPEVFSRSPEWMFRWWQERFNDIRYYEPEGFLY